MPLVLWITVAGLAMAATALVGSVTLVLSEAALKRLLLVNATPATRGAPGRSSQNRSIADGTGALITAAQSLR